MTLEEFLQEVEARMLAEDYEAIEPWIRALWAEPRNRILMALIWNWLWQFKPLGSRFLMTWLQALRTAAVAEGEGAVVAGGIGLGTIAAVTFAVLAVGFAAWRIGGALVDKYGMSPKPDPSGAPCGDDSGTGKAMANTDWGPLTARSMWGDTAAYNKAVKEAKEHCASMSKFCHGNCPGGGTCQPNMSLQNVDHTSLGLWTTVEITYRCPCECLH